jgi:hypothetical protein
MRSLPSSELCVSVYIYKQTTPEIQEVACTRRTIMDLFARDVSDMGYQPGGEIMASLLPVVTHMQKLAY